MRDHLVKVVDDDLLPLKYFEQMLYCSKVSENVDLKACVGVCLRFLIDCGGPTASA